MNNFIKIVIRAQTALLLGSFVNCSYGQLSTVTKFGQTFSNQHVPSLYSQIDSAKEATTYIGGETVLPDSLLEQFRAESKREINSSRLYLPLSSFKVTSGWGLRRHPVYGTEKFHHGIDLKASYEVVYAFTSGYVSRTSYDSKSGYYIVINHGSNIETLYAHLSRIDVYKGQLVAAGQIIAISGSTGASTGPHLHFSLRYKGYAVDPRPLLRMMISSVDRSSPRRSS